MFTREHFNKFAAHINALNAERNKLQAEGKLQAAARVHDIAVNCFDMIVEINDNPRFNRDKFEQACGF